MTDHHDTHASASLPTQVTPPPLSDGELTPAQAAQAAQAAQPTEALTPEALAQAQAQAQSRVDADTPPTAEGDLVSGRYQLRALLGRGGMGSVYKALDTELGEEIALKFLARELTEDPALRERFRREVVLARKVTHRNVARMFDIGEHRVGHGGTRFLTMELIDGRSLQSVLAQNGALPCHEVLRITRAVIDGLGAAHAVGVVHRDLKPDNVMLERSGRIVITDFGVARATHSPATAQLTGGQMVGTPAYMAPEQLEGRADLDARADLFALGVMLYHMLTGELPWSTANGVFALIRARLDNPTPRLDATPFVSCPHLADLVARLMAESPDDRFGSTEELREAVEALPADHSDGGPPTHPAGSGHDAPTRLVQQPGASRTGKTSVAVLPLANRGPSDDDYLASGLAEEIVDVLSTVDGLRVRPHRDSAQLVGRLTDEGRELDLAHLGRELGVDVLVEGSLRRSGDQLRISARLQSVADGFQLWARRFQGGRDDPFAITDEIACAIADALTVEVDHGERQATPAAGEAADLYLRARHAIHAHYFETMAPAIELFEQALERSPRDPRVCAAASSAHARHIFFATDNETADRAAARARELAERALAADPRRGDAQHALGLVCLYQADPIGAVAALRGALLRSPDLADAHAALGRILVETGPIDDAIRHLEQALRLDASLPQPHFDLVRPLALASGWDQVAAALEPLFGGTPTQHSLAQMVRGRYALWYLPVGARDAQDDTPPAQPGLATELMRQIYISVRLTGELTDAQRAEVIDHLGRGAGRHRRGALFSQILCELAAYVGQTDEALDHLEQAITAGLFDLMWLRHAPILDRLRDQPRFAAAQARVEGRLETLV